MILRQESLPQANIYSSKVLFDQMEDRNKKRMNQILRRKKAFSTRNKTIKFEEEKSDLSPKNEKEEININTFSQFNKSIFNYYNENTNENFMKKCEKNSLNDINNNSTNHNSSILNKDSQINGSNFEEETKDIFIENKSKTMNKSEYNNTSDIYKHNNSIVNIDIINCEDTFLDESKENENENNYLNSNKFAIKYLSSSLDSFIKLDNHLVTKAKLQNNCFTDSYSQALEFNFDDKISNIKNIFTKNYLVTEIIKEEKESETPLKINKKDKEKNKNKNIFNNENNEEIDMIKRMARRRAYSKRIRNNILNKNLKDVFEIKNENKKNSEKTLNQSKSCKRINKNNINLTYKNCNTYRNINIKKKHFERKKNIDEENSNNFARKTICNFKKRINLNNSFNIFNKNDINCNIHNKTLTAKNSSKNIINKNEKLCKKMITSKSNLIIFKKNPIQKNKNELNCSMNNLYPKTTRKIQKSKSAKRINDITLNNKNDKQITIHKKEQINNLNKTKILKKNPTMGKLNCIKRTSFHNKENNSKIVKNNDLNKTVLIKSNKNESSFLNNTISFRNLKSKKSIVNNNVNTRNSMPFKQKTKKIVKNILIKENNKNSNKLKLNKSYCCLISTNKNS